MSEIKTLSKFRQKRLKNLAHKTRGDEEQTIGNYFYPKNNLYTRQEFELLDTIYSDDPIEEAVESKQPALIDNFWPQNKEEYLNPLSPKSNTFTNMTWFISGVMLTSVIWLIYFQLSVHEIKAKHETQIVFNKSVELMTDKTADKEITKSLEKKNTGLQNKSRLFSFSLSRLFKKNELVKKEEPKIIEEQVQIAEVNQPAQVIAQDPASTKYYSVQNGDSLWIIAKKSYSDPSPANIEKIAKANKLRLSSTLSLGQKLVIPQ